MAKKDVSASRQATITAQPRLHQRAPEIQAYGTVSHGLPLELEEPVRLTKNPKAGENEYGHRLPEEIRRAADGD